MERLRTDAAKHVDASLWALPDAELIDCLHALHQLEQTVAALRSHVLRQIDGRGIAAAQGFRNTAGWLRDRLHLDPFAARDMVEQSAAVDRRPNVDRAFSMGAIDSRQAAVIAAALDELPSDVDLAVIADAEAILLDLAAEFEAGKLRRLGARILDHVAPDVAEQAERVALNRAEARAQRRRGLSLSVPVEGAVRVGGYLTVEDAAVVNAALDPLCTPRPGDERTAGQRRADALVDICQLALRTGSLPDNGGEPPQVVVTVPYDVLVGELRRYAPVRYARGSAAQDRDSPAREPSGHGPQDGEAQHREAQDTEAQHREASGPTALGCGVLDTGERISPALARRLACDAQIVPMILGGASQPVDVGRARRLFSGPMRRALVVRDKGCAFPLCDRPALWCDAHHMVSWLDGGPTSVANGVLLCRHHHRLIHCGKWAVRLGTDGLPEFIPPAYIDPARRPRRNLYHRRT